MFQKGVLPELGCGAQGQRFDWRKSQVVSSWEKVAASHALFHPPVDARVGDTICAQVLVPGVGFASKTGLPDPYFVRPTNPARWCQCGASGVGPTSAGLPSRAVHQHPRVPRGAPRHGGGCPREGLHSGANPRTRPRLTGLGDGNGRSPEWPCSGRAGPASRV